MAKTAAMRINNDEGVIKIRKDLKQIRDEPFRLFESETPCEPDKHAMSQIPLRASEMNDERNKALRCSAITLVGWL